MKKDSLNRIAKLQKLNIKLYNETMIELYGELLGWSFVKSMNKGELSLFLSKLTENHAIDNSIIDVKKMTNQILLSSGQFGTFSSTDFKCSFCDKLDTWNTTNTPETCRECAEKISMFIAKNWTSVIKDDKLDLITNNVKKITKLNNKDEHFTQNNKLKFIDKLNLFIYKFWYSKK